MDKGEPKKKRGRKPKNNKEDTKKIEENIEIKVEKIKKKRGRKPKNKLEIEPKLPKKRGRKPKELPKIDNIQNEEPIILHIPIKDLDNNIPEPFKYNNNFEYLNMDNTLDEVKEEQNKQNKLNTQNVLLNYNKLCNTYNNTLIEKDKIHPIFYEFNSHNKKLTWPKESNIDCLWCCHNFDTMPFGIPVKKVNDVFYMFGNFCSPECASAYNFDNKYNDVWERYSLINYLYGGNDKIKIAPPRLALKKFGGYLSINDFRKDNKNYNKSYKIYLPPMISFIPMLEEINLKDISYDNLYDKSHTNNLISSNELKIKRSKPLPDSANTLDNCMNLKYI